MYLLFFFFFCKDTATPKCYTSCTTLSLHAALPIWLALAITRESPERASDFARRIDSAMVAELVARLPRMPAHAFVCGSNAFVNIAADGALMAGLDAAVIKTERYEIGRASCRESVGQYV